MCVNLVHIEYEQQGHIFPDMTDVKHLMNVQERAHLAHRKMHYGNNLPDQPCVLHVLHFARVLVQY